MNNRSSYTIRTPEDGYLGIIDNDLGGRSVTNDAENVIADLVKAGIDLSKTRVLYRDSCGAWDGLATEGGRFVGFVPFGAPTFELALALWDGKGSPT